MNVKIDDVTYEWFGGFGAIIQSRERGVKVGDVRMIRDELFHVFAVERHWWRSTVSWTMCKIDAEKIRELKAKFFGCQNFH